MPFLLLLFWLGASWEAYLPHPDIPSNATIFSHVYTVKVAGENEGGSPPPQEALGPPSTSQGGGLYEHTLEGPDQEHVIFTHRINLPPQACGCPPGTEDTRELLRRLVALENEVRILRDTCHAGGGCCPAAQTSTQASKGQTDIRTLCSHHGSFDLSRCLCECESGWGGPTCAEPECPGGCGGPERGKCINGHCQCQPGFSGTGCEEPPLCPEDCNDQGRCVDGRCTCFPGYGGPSCSEPACPQNCHGHGQCVSGQCRCNPGYSGADCTTQSCPNDCNRHGECHNGRCVCEPGFTGPGCGTKTCPNDCNRRGECHNGRCVCEPGFTGPACGTKTCPNDCNRHGECHNGRCVCEPGFTGPACGTKTCPNDCNRRGECHNGRCVCEPGFTGPACGTKTCLNDCNQRGHCLKGAVCACFKGYAGPDCGQLACPEDCSGHGECQNGICLCHDGYSEDDCSVEIPSIGVRVSHRDETSFRLEWNPPEIAVDGYEIQVAPKKGHQPGETMRLSGTKTVFERTGLKPGEEYTVTIQAEKGQHRGPSVTQTVRTRIAPPQGLQSSQVTGNTLTLQWEPPASRPDGYLLSYVPLVASRPIQALKRVELPAAPESVTLEGLEGSTRYRITLVARQDGENSRATSIVISTAALAPIKPVYQYLTPAPSSHIRPDISSSEPEVKKPGTKPYPGHRPSNTTLLPKEHFLKKMTQNISSKLSPYNGTLLERLESYLHAINFPLRGSQTIPSVARDIYLYLKRTKPIEFQERIEERLVKETSHLPLREEFPIEGTDSVYSDGYIRPDHAKPAVVSITPDHIEVSLDSVRGVSDNVVIRYRNTANGEGGELVVSGDASSAVITGLAPGTTYLMEIHGVVKGHSSKSYSFITATAPRTPATDEIQTIAQPTLSPEAPLRILNVTEVSPDTLRVTWSAPPDSFRSFSLHYRDPKSSAPSETISVPGTERSVHVTGLRPGTHYEMELHGETPDGTYSAPLTTKTITAEPEKPSLGDLSLLEVTDTSARLSWDVPAGTFDSFVIQYKDARGKPSVLPVDRNSREAIIPNLVPSQKYKFNLYGLTGRKRLGPVSLEIVTEPTADTKDQAPVRPSLGELSVLDVTRDSVRLHWTVPTGSFDSFSVQYKDADGQPRALPVDGDAREVTVTNLTPSHKYKFNLYGVSGRKRSGPLSTDATTGHISDSAEKIPVHPSLGELSVLDITSDSVGLHWTVPTGTFDSFLVQYKDADGQPQALPVDGDAREVTVNNLAPSRRYKFNLYGVSGRKRSGPISTDATTAHITDSEETTPVQPSLGDLSVLDVTSDSVGLHWTVPTGHFDTFLVQYKDADGQPQTLPVDGDAREVTVNNLDPSHRYKFNLYGVAGRKRSSPLSTDATTAHVADTEEQASVQPSLGELSVLDVTRDSVRLQWTVPTGRFDSFLVQYKDADGQPQVLPIEGDAREVTVTNLVPSRRYKFNLYGISGRKRSGPISTLATTEGIADSGETIPVQPSLGELSVLDVTSDSIGLHWTVPTGRFDSFLVQYKDADGQPRALPVNGGAREVTVTNLAPSRKYKFNLYGVSGRKRSGPISTDATTARITDTQETIPVHPSLGELSVLDVTSDSIGLHWTVPTGRFDSFLVQYKDANGQPQALPVDGGARDLTVNNLDPSHRYKFNLYGVSGRKRSSPLSTDATTASPRDSEETIPVQPSLGELSVLDVTSDSIGLHWTVPTGRFDSFLVQYKDADGQPQALPMDGDAREVTVNNLDPSHRYKFNLYGISGRKRSGPISTDATTAIITDSMETVPVQPSLGELSVLDVGSDSVDLHWTVPTGRFDSFLVQYKDADGQPQALPVDGDAREVTVNNLDPSHRYKFNLYGVSGQKSSSPLSTDATTDSVTDSGETTSVHPSLGELSVLDVTRDSVGLHWTVPTGNFDSFLVQYKDADGQPQALPVDGDARDVTVTSLAPSRRYKFNLYGVSGRKRSGPISTDATTAHITDSEETIPVQPSLGELSVLDVTHNSVRLHWTVLTGSFDSFLVQYKDADGQPQALPVDGHAREVTVTSLAPSHRYKFNLYGVSGRKRTSALSADASTAPFTSLEKTVPVQPNLGELSVLDVTRDSVRLHWTVPTGSFDSFLVQYKDADGQPQVLPVDGDAREVTVNNLAPSRRYKFNLYGISGHKRSGPISTDATTAHAIDTEEQAPVKPSLGELSVLDVTRDSVRLYWTVPTGSFDSFLVQYKDADGQPQELPVDGDAREVTVTNLDPSHRYKFNLYGVSGHKHSSPFSTDATTDGALDSVEIIPVQPILGELSVLDVTRDSVLLHWTVPTGNFDSFLVQYKDANGQPQALPVDGDAREVTVTNLDPSHRYKFNFYGVSGHKRSSPLSTDATTVHVSDPETPSSVLPSLGELSVLDVTSDSVRLYWTVPTGNFDSFSVQYKDADGQPQALPVDGGAREVTVTNLAPSRKYKFNLYGLSGRKRSSHVSTVATTAHAADTEKPSPVYPSLEDLSVLDVGHNTIHLHWNVPTGSFDSFLVQYRDADGQPQALPVEGGAREVTVTNLAPSRRYKFNLYGVSGQKRSSPLSTDATTAPLPTPPPVQPSLGQLSVSDVSDNSARLSWTVPSGSFDSFVIQYKDTEGQVRAIPVEGNTYEIIVPNLVPGRKYKFNLYGISSRKRFGPVSVDTMTASTTEKEDVPMPSLGELLVSEITSNSALLSWTTPTGKFDSFLLQYTDEEGQAQAQPVEGGSHKVTVQNLSPSHTYKFNLYGFSSGKHIGPISSEATTALLSPGQEVESGPPGPALDPSLGKLSASNVTSNSVRLSWNVPAGTFDSFLVEYKDAESKPQAIPVDKESNTIVLSYLVPSHRYVFNLYGVSGHRKVGPASVSTTTATVDSEKRLEVPEEKEQEVPAEMKPRLGVLLVPEVTSSSARLSWTVPGGSFDSFSVQYKDAEGKPQALPVSGQSREVIVSSLSPSHKYRFNLYGISGKQRLGPISASAVTTAAETSGQFEEKKQPEEVAGKSVQPSLGNVTVSEITSDSLLLSWTTREGSFDSFLIQYKDATGKPQLVPISGALRSLHLYNLKPSQRYQFDVFGVSSGKQLGPLSVKAVTGAPDRKEIVQPQLGELSVTQVTNDSVALSWTVPAGHFDSFLIQYKDSEGRPQVLPVNGSSRDAIVHSLAPSHRYKFNLYGLNGRKRLGPISADAVTGRGTQPLKLGVLSAHNVTSESLLLSWTVASGNFDSFIIQYRDAGGKSHALPVDGSLRSLRFHELVPSHRYKFNLYGVSRRKRLGPVSVEAVTAPAPSGLQVAPQPRLGELSASNITGTSLSLAWSVPSGKFESFSIEYRDAEGNPQVMPLDSSSRDVVITNLTPSHRYKFNLYGISEQKRHGPASTEALTAQTKDFETKPKLGDLSISEVTHDSVRLSWTVPSGKFDSFLVQYKDDQGKPQRVPVNEGSRTVVIYNLIPSHKYKFNLYGLSGSEQLGPVSTDAVTAAFSETSSRPTPSLDHPVVSEVTDTTLQLTWDAPEGEFDSFQVRWKDSPGNGRSPAVPSKEVKVPGDKHSVTLQGLSPNTDYSLTVHGIKEESEVAQINTAARTSGLELGSPRDLRFSDIHETSVVANWRPPSSRIDGYKVSFQPTDAGEPKSILLDGSEPRTIIEGLTPGASYEVAVMSVRGFEESEPLVGYITTVPDGPSDLRAVNVTDTSAVLTWRPAVAEMNNYIVTYGPIAGQQVSESVPGNRVQLPLSELNLDMEYWASVYGEKEGNRSSPVSATFTTGADGPRDLQATEISPRSARLTWSPPRAPSEGYLLSYETPNGRSMEVPLDASITSHELQNLIPSSRYQVQVQAVRRDTPTAPISTSFTTGHLTYPFPRDCSEESQNGPGPSRVATIYLEGNQERPLQVFCDMETDGGGWTVFQRRMNGETDFWRDWQDYALGFGNLTREFWLGNEALHQLTTSGDYVLRVDLRAGAESVYATYQNFRVDPSADYYRLHLDGYRGTAGDALSYHSGSVFSTRDKDPNRLIIPCAISYRGAWWYRNCHYTNLNGLYSNNRDHQGISWYNWKGFEFSIPFTEMKLRPSTFQPLRRA